jgi:hypothetical protein
MKKYLDQFKKFSITTRLSLFIAALLIVTIGITVNSANTKQVQSTNAASNNHSRDNYAFRPHPTPTLPPAPDCTATSAAGTVKAASTPQNYYASPTGNDSNPGTLASPWKTINASVNKLSAGDTLYLRGGTWIGETVVFNTSGTSTSHITMTNYPGETPILNGNWAGEGIKIYGSNLGYIDISGIEITRYSSGIYLRNAKNIQVSNMKIHYLTGMAIGFTDTIDSSISNSQLYDVATGNIVQLDTYQSQVSGIVIDNNLIHDSPGTLFPPCNSSTGENCGHGGVDFLDESASYHFSNIAVTNNKIYNIASNPIYMHASFQCSSSGDGYCTGPWTNITIANNEMYNSGWFAQLMYMHDSFVTNNYIHNINQKGIYSYWHANQQIENTLFKGNRIVSTIDQNIYIHDGANNTYEANDITSYAMSGNGNIIKDPVQRTITVSLVSGSFTISTTTGQTFTVNGASKPSGTLISGAGTYIIVSTAGTGIAAPTAISTIIPTAIPTAIPTIIPTTIPTIGSLAVPTATPTVFLSASPTLSGMRAPTVRITCPASGKTYSSPLTTLAGIASDDVKINRVQVRVGSTGVWKDVTRITSRGSTSTNWNTSGLTGITNGSYTIYTRAIDVSGRISSEKSIRVNISAH